MSLNNTRLVHILAETAPSHLKLHQQNFIDRISDIASLHDTISLRALHETLGAAEPGAADIPIETARKIKTEFFKTRALLVRSLAASFSPNSRRMTHPFPTPERVHSYLDSNHAAGPLHSVLFAPFRNFYTARQGDIEAGIHRFRLHYGTMLSDLSNELACLATLDKSFRHMFSKYARHCFSAVPELLEAQFGVLFAEQQQSPPEKISIAVLEKWMGPNGWIFDFCQKMRDMLLAELETRLLPLQGLIESLPHDDQG